VWGIIEKPSERTETMANDEMDWTREGADGETLVAMGVRGLYTITDTGDAVQLTFENDPVTETTEHWSVDIAKRVAENHNATGRSGELLV
jgi:hypothetical protein